MRSVPAHWLTDDAMLATLIDIMDKQADKAKSGRRRRR